MDSTAQTHDHILYSQLLYIGISHLCSLHVYFLICPRYLNILTRFLCQFHFSCLASSHCNTDKNVMHSSTLCTVAQFHTVHSCAVAVCSVQYAVCSCSVHSVYSAQLHTVLSPIILSPRNCPIVNIRGHPAPDFRNKYFNYCRIAGTGTDARTVKTDLLSPEKFFAFFHSKNLISFYFACHGQFIVLLILIAPMEMCAHRFILRRFSQNKSWFVCVAQILVSAGCLTNSD